MLQCDRMSRSKKRVSSFLFGGVFLIVLLVFFGMRLLSPAKAAWFDESWAYRNAIPISSHTAAETNVYISTTIDTSASGQFQSDCGDLRFTDTGGNLLPYYIVSGCTTATTVAHIFFDSFPAGAQTIYYYYGNPSAANGFSAADFATVATNYAIGTVAVQEKSAGPVAYWKFDEGYGNTVNNSTSRTQLNGTITNATWQSEDKCVSGKCLYFDGSGDYVIVNDPSNGALDFDTNSFTISVWVRTEDNSGEIIHKMEGATQIGYQINLADGWGGDTYGMIDDGPNQSYRYGKDGSGIYNNNWHQITIVFDRSQTYPLVYLDGRANTGSAGGSTPESLGSISNAANFYIGGNTSQFKGFIDDVKIYNYSRTAAQIKADFKSRGTTKGVSVSLGSSSKNLDALSNGLVGYWKMDESAANSCTGSVNDSCDSSGNSNDLAHQTTFAAAAGKFGNAQDFEAGTSDYLSINDNSTLSLTSSLTLSAWFNTESQTNGQIIAKDVTGGRSYYLRQFGTTIRFLVSSDGTSATAYRDSSTTLSNSTWYHVAGVYNSTNRTMDIYLNGALDNGTLTGTVPASVYDSTTSLRIANDENNSGGYFDGKIDDVRIYNRALSSKEVRDLYSWAPGPIGWWKFDEHSGTTINDSSGVSNSISVTGSPTWTTGKFGSGLSFNGSSDRLNVTATTTLQPKNIGVDFWVYPTYNTTTGDWKGIITGPYGNGYSNSWRVLDYNKGIIFQVNVGDAAPIVCTTSASTVPRNTWSHIAASYDQQNLRVFINGVQQCSTAETRAINYTTSSTMYLGFAQFYFQGKLDDIRFYNYARTQKQIVEDMNAGHPVGGSPVGSQVGYWKFDEGYGATTFNSGNGTGLNGTITGAAWSNNGKFGKSLAFVNGSNTIVSVNDNDALDIRTGGMTLSAWIKTSATGVIQNIIRKDNGAGLSGYIFRIETDNRLRISYSDADSSATSYAAAGAVTDGAWHYVAAVYDRDLDMQYLYVDGKQVDSDDPNISGDVNNTTAFRIGMSSATSEAFSGLIDEVKVYNSALTADEIKLDMNRGSVMVLGTFSDTSQLTGGSVASSSAQAAYCILGDTATCSAPIGEWNLEEKTGTTANDSSGNGNTGTLTNNPTWSTGKFGSGINFSNNYVTSPIANEANFDFTSDFTVSGWINVDPTNSTSYRGVLGKYNNDSTGWDLGVQSDGLRMDIRGSSTIDAGPSGTLGTNTWKHFGIVNTTTSIKIYIDGVLVNTTNGTWTSTTNNNAFTFGNRGISGTTGFIGKLDNIRVFNYARTPAQIAWDYNRSGPVGYWKFDECQGSTLNDSSGNGNAGTWNGTGGGTQTAVGTCTTASTAWGNGATGKFNSSLNFDGSDDYVQLAHTASPNPSTQLTVSAWIKVASLANATNYNIFVKQTWASKLGFRLGLGGYGACASLNCLFLGVGDGVTLTETTTSGVNLTDTGAWHHVVGTFSSGAIKLYVDGNQRYNTTSAVTSIVNDAVAGRIGRHSTGAEYFPGQIDDVRVFNYALTATQVKQLYNGGSGVQFAPLTGSP